MKQNTDQFKFKIDISRYIVRIRRFFGEERKIKLYTYGMPEKSQFPQMDKVTSNFKNLSLIQMYPEIAEYNRTLS